MTIKKAIEMLQNLRNAELETIKIFGESNNICNTMTRVSQGKADYLEKILHEIEPKTYPCSHPKKCMSVDEKNIPKGAGPNLYSQEQVKEFFQNDFEIETMKDSLFYGNSSGSFKAIFTVLRNKKI